MGITPSDIEALVTLFRQSNWDELHLKLGNDELLLSNDSNTDLARSASSASIKKIQNDSKSMSGAILEEVQKTTSRPDNWIAIRSPTLGTFYRASAPDAAPYVAIGTTVGVESELCLIEVMKLFTTVRAEYAGVVREICVGDGDMVEFNQPLFWIEPD